MKEKTKEKSHKIKVKTRRKEKGERRKYALWKID
jgi:hypothetical protein